MPGKYSGVVVFDRWDNGYFVSSFSQFYISETIKKAFRKYSGKNIQIFVEDITQYSSSSSGRIDAFKYIRPTPVQMRSWVRMPLKSLRLRSHFEFTESGMAQFVLSIQNIKRSVVEVFGDELSFLVLKQKQEGVLSNDASDGSSLVITGGHGFNERCIPSNWTVFDVKDGHIAITEISGAFGTLLGEKFDVSNASRVLKMV